MGKNHILSHPDIFRPDEVAPRCSPVMHDQSPIERQGATSPFHIVFHCPSGLSPTNGGAPVANENPLPLAGVRYNSTPPGSSAVVPAAALRMSLNRHTARHKGYALVPSLGRAGGLRLGWQGLPRHTPSYLPVSAPLNGDSTSQALALRLCQCRPPRLSSPRHAHSPVPPSVPVASRTVRCPPQLPCGTISLS